MTPAKAARVEKELDAMAKKVFSCVPAQETWSHHQITAELRRRNVMMDRDKVRGVLNTIRATGLIREQPHDHFRRNEFNDQPQEITTMAQAPENTTTTHRQAAPAPTVTHLPPKAVEPTRKLSTLDRLARISLQFRALADELDDIAIQADEDMKAQGQDSETLRQLQKLLGNVASRA